jgi:hypothetical protein
MAAAQTPSEQAAGYGWSLAVINSNPELKSLFAQATSSGPGGNWSSDNFVAHVRDTQWFKKNSDTARQAAILRVADPATYHSQIAQQTAIVQGAAAAMGANLSVAQMGVIGETAVQYGWNSDQIKQHLVSFVSNRNGGYTGAAGTEVAQYKQLAAQYGVSMSSATLQNFVHGSALGSVNQDTVKNWMIAQATSRYPALAGRLQQGETVEQIADPYIQSQAKILETNPNSIPVTDPGIQRALSAKDAKGQPATMSVWQYEQNLRQDPRFLKTQAAQDTGMSMAHTVLTNMGVAS